MTSRMFSSPSSSATEPVDAEGEAGVWRCAVAERVEQEAELALRLALGDAEQVEDATLDGGRGFARCPIPAPTR